MISLYGGMAVVAAGTGLSEGNHYSPEAPTSSAIGSGNPQESQSKPFAEMLALVLRDSPAWRTGGAKPRLPASASVKLNGAGEISQSASGQVESEGASELSQPASGQMKLDGAGEFSQPASSAMKLNGDVEASVPSLEGEQLKTPSAASSAKGDEQPKTVCAVASATGDERPNAAPAAAYAATSATGDEQPKTVPAAAPATGGEQLQTVPAVTSATGGEKPNAVSAAAHALEGEQLKTVSAAASAAAPAKGGEKHAAAPGAGRGEAIEYAAEQEAGSRRIRSEPAGGSPTRSGAQLAAEPQQPASGQIKLNGVGEVAQSASGQVKLGGAGEFSQPASSAVKSNGALEASAPASTASRLAAVEKMNRDPSLLEPELVNRLQRVMQRMQNEYGHEVRLVEGYRSQDRQEHLYQQGRSRPGPVVTWTRNSAHSQGRAVDVLIDGSYNNSAGYERLGRLAREEGLVTLGPRDPGHLELPAEAARSRHSTRMPAAHVHLLNLANGHLGPDLRAGAAPSSPDFSMDAKSNFHGVLASINIAPVAQVKPMTPTAVAAVATPAEPRISPPASVARVAPLLRPHAVAGLQPSAPAESSVSGYGGGAPEQDEMTHRHAGTAPARQPSSVLSSGAWGSGLATAYGQSAAAHDRGFAGVRRAPANRSGSGVSGGNGAESGKLPGTMAGPAPGVHPAEAPVSGPSGPTAPAGTDITGRIARLYALRDAQAATSPTRVLLELDGADGAATRVRLALRGNAVGATIQVTDPPRAEQLGSRIHELRSALEARGLAPERLQVRTAGLDARPVSTAGWTGEQELARVLAPRHEAPGSSHDRRGAEHQQNRHQPDPERDNSRPESQRERSRREHDREERH